MSGAQQVRAPLAHPLLLLPRGVEVVHQIREGVIPDGLHGGAVLGDGAVGEIRHLPVFFQTGRCEVIFLYSSDQIRQFPPEPVLPRRAQGEEAGVRLPGGAEGQLPCDEGRDAEVAVQQEGVDPPLRIGGGQLFPEARLRLLRHRQTSHGGRRLIVEPRQHLPLRGHIRVHPAETVDDAALPVQQDQIGTAAHGFQHQRSPARPAEVVGDVDLQPHQPLQGRLGKSGNAAPHQMLAQQHAEHGGLRRVVPGQTRQLEAGSVGSGAQQQPLIPPQQQDDLVPHRLLDLVDPQARQLRPQLLRHRLHTDPVQWHGLTPPSSRGTAPGAAAAGPSGRASPAGPPGPWPRRTVPGWRGRART